MELLDKLKMLPHTPGVYRFIDKDGTIIYVGKAKDLKNRVSQYFQTDRGKNRKTLLMVSHIADIVHTVVDTEEDALLLENNLIKKFQPKYNILLKDGKSYPWIAITNEPFPRVMMTRNFKRDGSRYFGPYSSSAHARNLLELVNRLYKLRNCHLALTPESVKAGKHKVCLNYHINRCCAPCQGHISADEYMEQIAAVTEILKGNSRSLIKTFEKRMKDLASQLRFEEAQACKEKMELLESHYSRSLIVNAGNINLDVCSIICEANEAFGNFLRITNGCVTQSISMEIKVRIDEDMTSILESFLSCIYEKLRQYEQKTGFQELIVPFLPEYELSIPGHRLSLPSKGDRSALMELSRKNAAALKFEKLKHQQISNPQEHTAKVLENLRKDLMMEELPQHIECFDNSNIQGSNPVASCVVFKDAVPSKKDYRHFNIKTVIGANDFASMKEVVNRRYSRMIAEGESLPQLIVIDGGKGQVGAAVEALEELGIYNKVKLIGLAKRLEEIIVPGDPYPLFLDKNSTSLKVIMHIRDEAHRFGITHHRNRRSKAQIKSELDNIPGVGKTSRDKLATRYGTISNIKKRPFREIVNTIGKRSANALFNYFGLDKGN
ncbi:MAG: excinuclease ABC subunit UvrC [Candidatus Coprenecus sp.]|nr:excinuclease ABC subunit UvrC [Candidatus Coprenecus sp.]